MDHFPSHSYNYSKGLHERHLEGVKGRILSWYKRVELYWLQWSYNNLQQVRIWALMVFSCLLSKFSSWKWGGGASIMWPDRSLQYVLCRPLWSLDDNFESLLGGEMIWVNDFELNSPPHTTFTPILTALTSADLLPIYRSVNERESGLFHLRSNWNTGDPITGSVKPINCILEHIP